MQRLIEMIRLRRSGVSIVNAWKVTAHLKAGYFESFLYLLIALFLAFFIGFAQVTAWADGLEQRNAKQVMRAAHYERLNGVLASELNNLELVFIGCLTGDGVIVNGRNKHCRIREYKEAIS